MGRYCADKHMNNSWWKFCPGFFATFFAKYVCMMIDMNTHEMAPVTETGNTNL